MKTKAEKTLFEGKSPRFGEPLSNEAELAKKCPEEFECENEWSSYALKLITQGGSIIGLWKWKSLDQTVRNKQFHCFTALITASELSEENRLAVAGWMLSRMLEEVPPYIPSGKCFCR